MSPEGFELMALRRVSEGGVSEGGVTVAEGGYVHHGRPVTGELAEAMVRLHTAGCLAIGAPRPGGHRPMQTTVAGATPGQRWPQ